jgi:cell pole-organizing protein PopZ
MSGGNLDMRQIGEPSVEEILESIKKVIARDNRSTAAETRRVREVRGVAEALPSSEIAGEDDVLDLAASAEYIDDYAEVSEAPDASLITDDARSSMRESLAALAMLAEPGAQPQIVRSGETSLEAMARDLLRPALADWLDKHLPPMVERLVAAEIARIVGKRG